jgi:hypothetical protein
LTACRRHFPASFHWQARIARTQEGSLRVLRRPFSSGFNKAKLDSIPLTLLAPVDVPPGTALSVTLSARINCSHDSHASGTARLWFNDAQAKGRFDINGATSDYYLLNGSALGTAQGSGPKRTIDIGVDKRVACPMRPFTSFGTWSTTLP